ncbi:polysaccharide hydrolase [Marinobacter nanhaiticus D15-8W]|uniref:Polysaccharide hydrolase n=2 Tax=Marinobacter TaxID=2742 RepID=N6VZR9_9GAMM|nr:polysaccharide hydrolase [Marinobacter nanhaiticus D15-8W]
MSNLVAADAKLRPNPAFSPVLRALVVVTTLGLSACDSEAKTQDDATGGPADTPEDIGTVPVKDSRWLPAPGTTWAWQLQNYDNLDINQDVTAFDIDLFEGSEGGSDSLIRQLKDNGKKVICYFSAGTLEDWRPDAEQFAEGSVIADGDMQQWPGETWLDISNARALEQTIKPIMAARLDRARDAGCDAVEPDNVDAYLNDDETRGLISAADQLAYNTWLAGAAHDRGLSVGLKNDLDQLDALAEHFDFAVNEQCYAYGNECVLYEDTFLAAGKAVFNQEYYEEGSEGELTRTEFLNNACPYFLNAGISGLWSRGYDLDGTSALACSN